MHALGAFPRHLPPGIRKSFIILKYPCKALDGTVYWPGLQMARDSKEVWMGLMMDAGRIPEIGVTVDDGVQQHAVPVLLGPLTGPNGVPLSGGSVGLLGQIHHVVHHRNAHHQHTRYAYNTLRFR